jgi:hypothetical protein
MITAIYCKLKKKDYILLTPYIRVKLEKLIVALFFKEFSVVYGTQSVITLTSFQARLIQKIFPHSALRSIVLPHHLGLSFPIYLHFPGVRLKLCIHFLFPLCYMSHPPTLL